MKLLIAAGCALALAVTGQIAAADKSGIAITDAADGEEECPAAFQGASVKAEKMPGGVRIEFRNGNRAIVDDMREQLRAIGEMIEQHGTQQQTAGEDDEVEFPPVDIDVKDIVLGARVTVRASRLRDIPALRELAFGFQEFWKTSPCNTPLVSAR
jgi:hypothetical protein